MVTPSVDCVQKENIDAVHRVRRNFKKDGKDRHGIAYFETRLEKIKELWKKCEQQHPFVVTNKSHNKTLLDSYTAEYEETEDVVMELICTFKQGIMAFREKENKSMFTPLDSTSSSERMQGPVQIVQVPEQIRLERIKIPKFSGDYNTWTSFSDLFKSLVHDNEDIRDVVKMQHLLSSLEEDAHNLIKHLHVTESNYKVAWDLLVRRYDNKRIILTSFLQDLLDIPTVMENSSEDFKCMLDTTNEVLSNIQNLGIDISTWDPILIHILSQKLDLASRKDWEKMIGNSTQFPTLVQFKEFLETKFRTLEAIAPRKTEKTRAIANYAKASQCAFCEKDHFIFKCREFLALSISKRRSAVNDMKLCFNCLSNEHIVKQCPSKRTCFHCQKRHNSTLHPAEDKVSSQHISTQEDQVLLATAIISVKRGSGEFTPLRALIDQGSQRSFITERAAKELSLQRIKSKLEITGIGQTTQQARGMVTLNLKPKFSGENIICNAFIMTKITSTTPMRPIYVKPEDIQAEHLADSSFGEPGKIDILLGADVYGDLILDGLKKGKPNAQLTKLGWILYGPVKNEKNSEKSITMISCEALETYLRKFWEVEEVQGVKQLTPLEQLAEQHYEKTTFQLPSGSFVVSLPFNPECNIKNVFPAREVAVQRLLQMERKMLANESFALLYRSFMLEYISLGHMVKVPKHQIFYQNCHYLPHHAVLKNDSSTTKLRVVFDASLKTKGGLSLNDCLLSGPSIQNNIADILMRWRTFKIVIAADIEKMFRNIFVKDDDTQYQRIVWRNSIDEPIQDYCLKTVTYGTTCAPFLAMRTITQIAYDQLAKYPDAARKMLSDFYVDDLLTGGFNEDDVEQLVKELNIIMVCNNLKLRKWVSNCRRVLRSIEECDKDVRSEFDILTDDQVKMLGIQWLPGKDVFTFKIKKYESNKEEFTKRVILSEIAKLYDPLGWLQPCIVSGKILIQKLWLLKLSWDEKIPSHILSQWNSLKNSLYILEKLEIPRWIGVSTNAKVQLHGFCDASLNAYAAAIYIRTTHCSNSQIITNLLTSKSKVAPVKTISVPRLELCGALLLAELTQQVVAALSVKDMSIFYWTDSTVVISWLQSHSSKWKTFVANRVSKIQQLTNIIQWNHVISTENPADLASRGISPEDLVNSELWWHGPSWLKCSPNAWPQNNTKTRNETSEEIRVTCFTINQTDNNTDCILFRYSTLTKLTRIVALCLRFKLNTQVSKEKRVVGFIRSLELKTAISRCVFISQQLDFKDELSQIQHSKTLRKGNKLLSLTPYIDSAGILRVGGRLKNASATSDQKHPAIINKGYFARLIVEHYHRSTMHGGCQLVVSMIRQIYWIIGCTSAVRQHIRKCITCFKFNCKTTEQIMGQLPSPRVNPSRPFTYTGVDFAGPITIKWSNGRGSKTMKSYVALFVCFATKAIHLELIEDLTGQACVAGIRRFVSRRGMCRTIYSDCGTNFVAADKQLKKEYQNMIKSTAEIIEGEQIEWKFIPPGSPHFGGLWEAAVKLVKRHLMKCVKNTNYLTYAEMYTVLVQIEACVNSRPLCAVSSDSNDLSCLTPGHFLIGEALLSIPEDQPPQNLSLLRRWKLVQAIKQNFWYRWSKEYLSQLQEKGKWFKQTGNIIVNDLVLVKSENYPSIKWPLARVLETHTGDDGVVRVVTLKGANQRKFQRPVTKLARLPIDIRDNNTSAKRDETDDTESIIENSNSLSTSSISLFSKLLYVFCIVCCLIPNSFCRVNFTQVTGEMFVERVGLVHSGQGTLELALRIQHSDIEYDETNVQNVLRKINLMCKKLNESTESSECEDLNSHLQEFSDEISHKIDILRTMNFRIKRGILGELLTKIFGVNEEVYHDLDHLSDNQNTLRHSVEKQGKILLRVTEAFNKGNARIDAKFSRLLSYVNETMNRLGDANEMFMQIDHNSLHIKFLGAYERTNHYLREVFNKYSTITNALMSGSSIMDCLSIKELHDIVVKTSALLPNNTMILKVPINRIHIEHSEDEIHIKGFLPIVNTNQFELIKITAIPQHLNDSIFMITDIPQNMFAVNYDLQNYHEISPETLATGIRINGNLFILDMKIMKEMRKHPNCALNTIYNLNDGSVCETKIFEVITPVWRQLVARNKWICFTSSNAIVHSLCNGQRRQHEIYGTNLVEMTSDCSIITPYFTLSSDLEAFASDVSIYLKPISVNYNRTSIPVNIPRLNVSEIIGPLEGYDQFIVEEEAMLNEMDNYNWKYLAHHTSSAGLAIIVSCLIVFVAWYFLRRRNATNSKSKGPVRWYDQDKVDLGV